MSVARRNPRMAVAACVAGPLFNLLAGMSSSLLYQNVLSGPVEVHLDNGILLLIGEPESNYVEEIKPLR